MRLALNGFERAGRYRVIDGDPKYLAIYELSDMAVLDTPEYRRIKDNPSERTARVLAGVRGFTRYICQEIYDSGPTDREPTHLSVVAFPVPSEDAGALDDWYENEHVPRLLEAEDWLRVRRYRVRSGSGEWTDLALHDLASADVMASPERAAARQGPKRDALARRPWFSRSGRWLYERLSMQH